MLLTSEEYKLTADKKLQLIIKMQKDYIYEDV